MKKSNRRDDFARQVKISGWDGGGRTLPPIHPGELLREEFMKPLGLTPEKIAKAMQRHPEIPESDIAELIRELLPADEDSFLDLRIALALDRYFGLNAGFFWRVQAEHEIRLGLASEAKWLSQVKPLKRKREDRT